MQIEKQITNEQLNELGIDFKARPITVEDVDVAITLGPLFDTFIEDLHDNWFPVKDENDARYFSKEDLKQYLMYLIQERIKQVKDKHYDRAVLFTPGVYQLVGSVYKYYDKKKGVVLVPSQEFPEVKRTDRIDRVVRNLRMMEIPTVSSYPDGLIGSSPSALWATVKSNEVVAHEEITLLDALFTSIMKREIVSTVYGDPRIDYCHVRALVPAVSYLAFTS